MADNQESSFDPSNVAQPQMINLERLSILLTVGMTILIGVFAGFSVHFDWKLRAAASLGALGGLAHELAQSGGRILFFEKKQDGFYIGSLTGLILGAVAAVLVVRGLTGTLSVEQLSYEAFFAGLGLKGVTEAMSGQPVALNGQTDQPQTQSNQSQTPRQPGTVPILRRPPDQAPLGGK